MSPRPRSFVVAGALAVLGFSACSIHGEKQQEPAPAVFALAAPSVRAAAEPTRYPGCGEGDIFQKLCIQKPAELPNFRFDQVPAPYTDAAGCKAFDDAVPDERSCMCDKCFKLLQQCDALADCREELECITTSGCLGTPDCYLDGPAPPCRDVIDKIGNTSVATTIVQFLGECAMQNSCRGPK